MFELNDTFGFPADLTALIARERGLQIDEAGYTIALASQKARSRKDASSEVSDWWIPENVENYEVDSLPEFVGYDKLHTNDSKVLKYREVKNKSGKEFHIVLDKTPFYAESGGQIGDKGEILILDDYNMAGNPRPIVISDTRKENTLIIHVVSIQIKT